jgi:hypothetical protein
MKQFGLAFILAVVLVILLVRPAYSLRRSRPTQFTVVS